VPATVDRPDVKSAAARAHLPALTGLRFMLAVWVILHHLTGKGMMLERWAQSLGPSARSLIRGGYLAVAVFFVLSGFVLARRYSAESWTGKSLFRYTSYRFARIYPVYALSLLLVAPFIFLEKTSGKPGLVASYVLLFQGWAGKLPVGWNTPAWSLSCEIFFYACFPVLVILFRRANWLTIIAASALACMLPTVMRHYGVREAWKPLLHLGDFVIGIAAAHAFDALLRSRWRFRNRGVWFYLPALVFSVALIAHSEILHNAVNLDTALRPLNAVLLIGLALGGGLTARALSTPFAAYLGQASYSMYILHIPLLWWFKFCIPHGGAIAGLIYMVAAIGASAGVFHWFEEPANTRVRVWCKRMEP
jgi:peptidoglycan/LPS O-acetylase OafA/YrhL